MESIIFNYVHLPYFTFQEQLNHALQCKQRKSIAQYPRMEY